MTAKILIFVLLSLPACGALPYEVLELRAKRDSKIAEVNRAYVAELEKIQRKAMAAGNLESANEVQKEIATLAPDLVNSMLGRWSWGTGGELTLKEGAVATHTKWLKPGKWQKIGVSTFKITSDTGMDFTVQMRGDEGLVFVGLDQKTVIRKVP